MRHTDGNTNCDGSRLPGPAPGPLPGCFSVQCEPDLRVLSRGRVLLGGSPLRLLTLSRAGAAVFEALAGGATVTAAGAGAGTLARRLVDAGHADPVPPTGATSHPSSPPGACAMPGRDDVTLVIPVRDRAAELSRLLATVTGTCREVIVVDDGSTDATAAVARRAGVRVIRHDSPLGPASARMAGARAAATPLVAFVDSDVLPGPDWLTRLLPQLADPMVALVAPRVASAPHRALRARYEMSRSPLDLGLRPGPVRAGSRISYLPAAALLIRRELADFDPAMRYGEDVDLVWRLTAAGWSVRYEPAAVVLHQPRSSWRGWVTQRVGYGSSAAALALRHPEPLRPVRGAAVGVAAGVVVAAGSAAAVAAVAATAGVGAVVSAWRLRRTFTRLRTPVPRAGLHAAVLVARGRQHAGWAAADTARRVWLPLLAFGAGRPGRRVLLVAATIPTAWDWWRERPDVGLVPYVALRMADDAAYCAGVWWGCLHARTTLPLRPAVPLRPIFGSGASG
ncbi:MULTISPECIES: mycofactocin biosynthesis glycosyltransferase MftF [unclassified Frankia]|uniref:mycofactocin biosynthesis glycosyltransferase MftF n=1 Tax=unclassified Frankia TaxID=2632575 RepID=UPI002AD38E85|nr:MULTISPECIES: mycofactocin biosynthesis glycosyltransferase MftF [unclassified Frankia]